MSPARFDLTPAEAWLQTLVDFMPQLIWRADDLGGWTWSSTQWLRYTGQTSDQSSGSDWLKVVHPEDRETAELAWQGAPRSGEFHCDLRIRDRDGRYRWFQTRGAPVRGVGGEIVEWIGTSTDVDDLRQLQAEQKVLVAELQHRTRNLLAIVHSISLQTLSAASSLSDFSDRFEARLAALSRVQGVLSTSEHEPITIRRLLEMELRAHGDGQTFSRVKLSGPDTVVSTSAVQTLALAVHELATNALKYGALSSNGGHLMVDWFEHVRDDKSWLCVEWREDCAVEIEDGVEQRRGYGSRLIVDALPKQLNAKTTLEFSKTGVNCVIDIPTKKP